MPITICPAPDRLSDFLAGRLSGEAAAEIEQHVEHCTACQSQMPSVDGSDDLELVKTLRVTGGEIPTLKANDRAALERVLQLDPSLSGNASAEGNASAQSSTPSSDTSSAHEPAEDLGVLGVYKLLSKLGEGGMGAVYKAQHTRLRRTVAVKVLPADRVKSPDAIARFDREMEAVGALDHENIVRAFDAGEHDGRHYIAMEYVRGNDVSQISRARGPLPIADACEIVRQAAIGLQHAHEAGLVHRDIKPGNLMLTESGVVKILDLGLARFGHANSGGSDLTTTGQVMGTLDYMAPEQGGNTHAVDIRADIYSLGATLYKLLVGEAPFGASQYDAPLKKLMALATVDPVPLQQRRPEVPPPLSALVQQLLAKTPDDRPATPAALAAVLAPFCKGANLKALALNDSGLAPVSRGALDTASHLNSALAGTVTKICPQPEMSATVIAPPSSDAPPRSTRLRFVLVGLGGLALVLLAVVLIWRTRQGDVIVEIKDPGIKATFDESGLVLTGADRHEIRVTASEKLGENELVPGEHMLTVQRGDLKFQTDSFQLQKQGKTVLKINLVNDKLEVLRDNQPLGVREVTRPDVAATSAPAAKFTPVQPVLRYDGVSSYVEMPLTLAQTTPVTIDAWVLNEEKELRFNLRTSNGAWHFMRQPGGEFYWLPVGSDHKARGVIGYQQLTPGTWSHFAAVAEEGRLAIFIDGRPLAVKPRLQVLPNNAPLPSLVGYGLPRAFGKRPASTVGALRISQSARYRDAFIPPVDLQADNNTLVLYRFHEGQGNTVKDDSGNNRHGKIVGAKWTGTDELPRESPPAFAPAVSLAFDGQASYVEIPTLERNAPGSLTLEAWMFNENDASSTGLILRIMGKAPCHISIARPSAHLAGRETATKGGRALFSDLPLEPRRWTHVCYVLAADEARLFIDGRLCARNTGPLHSELVDPPEEHGAGIGGTSSINWRFKGKLAGLRVSKSARYAEDFTPALRFENDPDTLAVYQCDEGSGDKLLDSSGNNHHGKIFGPKWVKAEGIWNDPANASHFALDLNQRLAQGEARVEPPFTLRPSEPTTIEMYVTPRSAGSLDYWNLFVGGGGVQLRQQKNNWHWIVPQKDGTYAIVDTAGGVVPGRRTHLAGVSTGKELRLYVDGHLAGKCPVSGELNNAAGPCLIGGHAEHFERWSPFDGLIDAVRISKVARYDQDFTPENRFKTDADTIALYHCDEGSGDELKDSSGNNYHGKIVGAKWVKLSDPSTSSE